MTSGAADWLRQGQGMSPRLSWSIATEAPLVGLHLASETGELLAADEAGGLSLIDRRGKLMGLVRGKSPLRAVCWSDTGGGGISLVGDDRLHWFNRQLSPLGSVNLPLQALAIALDAHGHYAAVSLNSGDTFVYDLNRKRVGQFATSQPLVQLQFLVNEPAVLGVPDYGLLCCHAFDGTRLWEEKLWGTVGDLATTGDGATILLASYTHGIQCHAEDGSHRGSYQVGGTVFRVSTSFVPRRLAAATIEGHFYWLDLNGRIEWQAILPEEICRLACDPLGRAVICGFQSGRIMRLDWP